MAEEKARKEKTKVRKEKARMPEKGSRQTEAPSREAHLLQRNRLLRPMPSRVLPLPNHQEMTWHGYRQLGRLARIIGGIVSLGTNKHGRASRGPKEAPRGMPTHS